jgi:hypothetical protein
MNTLNKIEFGYLELFDTLLNEGIYRVKPGGPLLAMDPNSQHINPTTGSKDFDHLAFFPGQSGRMFGAFHNPSTDKATVGPWNISKPEKGVVGKGKGFSAEPNRRKETRDSVARLLNQFRAAHKEGMVRRGELVPSPNKPRDFVTKEKAQRIIQRN